MLTTETKSRTVIGLIIALCLAGLLLRLYLFSLNRSFWIDEAMLALNIVNRSFLDLLGPLDFNQGAPIGFLYLQKAAIIVLGGHDYVLRLVPLFAGLVSIPIMVLVSKQQGGPATMLVSAVLFSFSPRLIYYASENKQYSTDVLMTLVLIFLFQRNLEERAKLSELTLLGAVGALAIWISQPSVFVQAGILSTLGLSWAIRKDWRRLLRLVGAGAAWALSLGVNYMINLRHLRVNDALLGYWNGNFAPPPWINAEWYSKTFLDMLKDPGGLPTTAVTTVLLLTGLVSLAWRRWPLALAWFAPIGLTVVASGLRLYPFSGRLLLFLLPLLFLLLAEGVDQARTILLKVNRPLAGLAVAALALYLSWEPAGEAYKSLQSPVLREHIKPTLAYVKENRTDADIIYIYYAAKPAFDFYAPAYELERTTLVPGIAAREDPARYLVDVEGLRGKSRVWFIFAHNCSWCRVNEQEYILKHLDAIGQKKGELLTVDAGAYLYDLAPGP